MKKILSLLLAFSLALSLQPAAAAQALPLPAQRCPKLLPLRLLPRKKRPQRRCLPLSRCALRG